MSGLTEPTWLPTSDHLATFLQSRTTGSVGSDTGSVGTWGGNVGEFNGSTSITPSQANDAIRMVGARVSVKVGQSDLTPEINEIARLTVLYLAAADLEASLFSRQTGSGQTGAEYWSKRGETLFAELVEAVALLADGDQPGPDDNVGANLAFGNFRPSNLTYADGSRRVL